MEAQKLKQLLEKVTGDKITKCSLMVTINGTDELEVVFNPELLQIGNIARVGAKPDLLIAAPVTDVIEHGASGSAEKKNVDVFTELTSNKKFMVTVHVPQGYGTFDDWQRHFKRSSTSLEEVINVQNKETFRFIWLKCTPSEVATLKELLREGTTRSIITYPVWKASNFNPNMVTFDVE